MRKLQRNKFIDSAYKIYAKLLTKRINIINEALLTDEQSGFGETVSVLTAFLQQLIQERREFILPTYLLFIYYEKTFDTVTRGKLWQIMKKGDILTT